MALPDLTVWACPRCGAPVDPKAMRCSHCQQYIRDTSSTNAQPPQEDYNNLPFILKDLMPDVTHKGIIGPLTYFMTGMLGLYIWDSEKKVLEKPQWEEFFRPTYWDSANHGITWDTKESVLVSLVNACGFDSSISFADDGTLIENRKFVNCCMLEGREGIYSLRIHVGGETWKDGFTEKEITAAANLMEYHLGKPRTH